jgi:hypothetical protein
MIIYPKVFVVIIYIYNDYNIYIYSVKILNFEVISSVMRLYMFAFRGRRTTEWS